jgi:hypothetical protein
MVNPRRRGGGREGGGQFRERRSSHAAWRPFSRALPPDVDLTSTEGGQTQVSNVLSRYAQPDAVRLSADQCQSGRTAGAKPRTEQRDLFGRPRPVARHVATFQALENAGRVILHLGVTPQIEGKAHLVAVER